MDDARFEESMSEMEREIDSLDIPDAERADLRRLVEETRARREAIRNAGEASRESVRRLGEHLARMRNGLNAIMAGISKLEGAAADARLAAKMAQFEREARERELRGEGRDHE